MRMAMRSTAGWARCVYHQRLLPNLLWFQLFWFLAVLVRSQSLALLIGLLILHFWLVDDSRRELRLVAMIAVPGIVVDTLWLWTGVYEFSPPHGGQLIPLWLCLMWVAFSGTVQHSLRWLVLRPALGVPVLGLGAPLSYFAGERLGAVAFGYGFPMTYCVLAVGWLGLMMWICFVVFRKWEQV